MPDPFPTDEAATPPALPGFPRGPLTLVFTDIEGSTRLLQALGPQYPAQLAAHRQILRACFAAHQGVEVDTQGDAFFAVFRRAEDAVRAVVRAQRELHDYSWTPGFPLRVRVGLHCGEPTPTREGYVGLDLHLCARLMSAGHGGQILLSGAAATEINGALESQLELRDLGEHRLKNLPDAERIFELRVAGLPADFPPLRTIDNRPHNLPLHLSPIVGRAREVAELRAQLQAGASLITLLGPGGTGKTRLSLAVAGATRDLWPDGVFFVPLAPIAASKDSPDEGGANAEIEEEIVGAVARALGLRDDGSQILSQRLLEYLRERQLLLLLDNFEHLLDGAAIVARWRERCPKLRILATSRIPLHLRGEQQFLVEPLDVPEISIREQAATSNASSAFGTATTSSGKSVFDVAAVPNVSSTFDAAATSHAGLAPDVAALARFGALALFVERARAVQPDFALDEDNARVVVQICARLDGLPLAIELAAARIKMLPPQALLARLDDSLSFLTGRVRDGLGHHQTLKRAIIWSYDLLDDGEKRLFRRLSVFRNGFTLESAEQVCAAPCAASDCQNPLDVFEGVASLLDQSLLMRRDHIEGEPRFLMLETIRQFALEELLICGETEELRTRHLEWSGGYADQRNAEMRGDFGRALRLFRADADNWRTAWNWAIQARPDEALQMASSAALLWNRAGSTSESYQRLETALLAAPDGAAKYRCRALQYLIQTDRNRANWQRYEQRLKQLEALAQSADLPEFRALALDYRMWDTVGADKPQQALEIGEEILRLRRECVNRARAQNLGAQEIQRCEDELLDAVILHVEVLGGAGKIEAAWQTMKESLAAKRASGDAGGLNLALCKYAQLLALNGRHDEARPFAEELVHRVQSIEDRSLSLAFYLHDAAEIIAQQGDAARALELLGASYAVCKENASTLGFMLVLRALAALHADAQQWRLFARLLGAMDATGTWNSIGFGDENEKKARAALGAAEFEEQRAAGEYLGTHSTIEAALQTAWLK